MATDQPHIFRPIPRRAFEITPASPAASSPPTPSFDSNPNLLDPKPGEAPPSRTRSILNLTSSTLFGIYAEEPATPFGPGAQTPSRHSSFETQSGARPASVSPTRSPRRRPAQQHLGFANFFLPLALRTALLFGFGVAYGVIITHLHDDHRLAPVKVEGIDRYDWRYLVFWGVAGVGLGSLLPWVDLLWEDRREWKNGSAQKESRADRMSPAGSGLGADWNPVVRSVGAFVGIAFAIRKLPWQSTLQVSLTLALVNPVLWYLIDRSKPGFLLSAAVGLTGTALLLGINPEMVPSPATSASPSPRPAASLSTGDASSWRGVVSTESIGVGTWIASVLFCSCVCFGNIGRRLAWDGRARARAKRLRD
ncbi:MAG: hypothetical protein M1832_003279 [Thelocarpon impressellum]|nr:MAG: hypothetical protein M1832_003279 [Thelocarpon impressellum]